MGLVRTARQGGGKHGCYRRKGQHHEASPQNTSRLSRLRKGALAQTLCCHTRFGGTHDLSVNPSIGPANCPNSRSFDTWSGVRAKGARLEPPEFRNSL
jgi:hypothetical protein